MGKRYSHQPPASAEKEVDAMPSFQLPDFKTAVIERLKPAVEKVGGHLGTAEDLEHLHEPVGYVKTGIYALDWALSYGKGLPCGRFVELFAPETVGKSALSEYIMGRFKKIGGELSHIDSEFTRDDDHLACYGINPGDYIDPDLPDIESMWDYARGVVRVLQERNEMREKMNVEIKKKNEKLAKKEQPLIPELDPEPPHLIVLDTVAGLPARAELKATSNDDDHVAEQARSNAKGVRVTVRPFSASSAVFLFINQIRDNPGARGYAPKTGTPGGRALKYAYSIRIKLALIETKRRGDHAVGHVIEARMVKNKLGRRDAKCKIMLSYRRGIDADWSNFLWFQEHRYIVAKGKSGFGWIDDDGEPFKRKEFGEWASKHRKLVLAARDAIYEKLRDEGDDSGSGAETSDASE